MPTFTQDTVIKLPSDEEDDRAFIRDVGARVAQIVTNSAKLPYAQRAKDVVQNTRALNSQRI